MSYLCLNLDLHDGWDWLDGNSKLRCYPDQNHCTPVTLRSGHYELSTTINRTATKSLALRGGGASSLVY